MSSNNDSRRVSYGSVSDISDMGGPGDCDNNVRGCTGCSHSSSRNLLKNNDNDQVCPSIQISFRSISWNLDQICRNFIVQITCRTSLVSV